MALSTVPISVSDTCMPAWTPWSTSQIYITRKENADTN